jgi:uncharacterized membrane protein YhaH (DUF805 family)
MRTLLRKLGLLGRSSRTTLINFLIINIVASVVLWFLFLFRLREELQHTELPLRTFATSPLWLQLLALGINLIWLWLAVRRFHDQDRPGWLALLPMAFGILAALGVPLPLELALLVLIGFLIALFLPGTIGPNSYGPDPRGWQSREHYLEQQEALGRRR